MAELSELASNLLEDAKRFLEKADGEQSKEGKAAYLHAAVMVGFASFEGYINDISSGFLALKGLSPHERGLLGEWAVDLVNGKFEVKENQLKMQRLEDRVLFLCCRFSKRNKLDRAASYWTSFKQAIQLRNKLTHPKPGVLSISQEEVGRALTSLIDVLNVVCQSVFKKKFPPRAFGLSSKRTF